MITIKQWMDVQNLLTKKQVKEVISLLHNIPLKELSDPLYPIKDWIALEQLTIVQLDSIQKAPESNVWEWEGKTYRILDDMQDLTVDDWITLNDILKMKTDWELVFWLFCFLSKDTNLPIKGTVTEQEFTRRLQEWQELPAHLLTSTESFFLQKLVRLNNLGQKFIQYQEIIQKITGVQPIGPMPKVNGVLGSLCTRFARGIYLHLIDLNNWVLGKVLYLLQCSLQKQNALKKINK